MTTPELKFLTQECLVCYSSKEEVVSQLNKIKQQPNFNFVYTNKVHYLNIPVSFDIETSSFEEGIAKKAIMYIWTMNINGTTFIGRTWEEFVELLNIISEEFELIKFNKRMIVYIHNLQYEWQFMRKWISWYQVFADKQRSPLYAVTQGGVEFRCSYRLSGYNLAKLGEELMTYKSEKAIGDLDYRLIRTSTTPLTETELHYCTQDTQVVVCYIQEEIERNGGKISNIPYTKTGYVRRFCREKTVRTSSTDEVSRLKGLKYRDIIHSLTLTTEEYNMAKRAFQGGFVHANVKHVNQTINNVGSIDFTSSYPYAMVSDYYPMSKPKEVRIDTYQHLQYYISRYCIMMDVKFINLKPINPNENPISSSRCSKLVDYHINNGRVIDARVLETTITELDYKIICAFYSFDKIEVKKAFIFNRGYLPTDLVDAILTLYEDKTKLKGVEGKEVEYLLSKGMLNSAYGMAVTDIVRDNIEFSTLTNDGWNVSEASTVSQLNHYNKNKARFLYYPWGVWVTAHARYNLFTAIQEFGDDYVYSDTDSIKATNMETHQDYITRYNDNVRAKLERAAKYHGFDFSRFEPKTIKGIPKLLGVWDYEGTYDKFKTLGAKRYLVQQGNDITFTVAGCNKKAIKQYMLETYGIGGVFDAFTRNLSIPPEKTGKLTHTYIDKEWEGDVVDYQGNVGHYKELSSIHLEQAPFKISMLDAFWDYITGVQQIEE